MKKVIITVRGTQEYAREDNDDIELVTEGEYSWSKEVVCFKYKESELTGLAGTTTIFRVEDGTVTLTRVGTVTSQMVFTEGEKNYFAYETPYGSLTMSTDTTDIFSNLRSTGGVLEIKYSVSADNTLVSRNAFYIKIKECD